MGKPTDEQLRPYGHVPGKAKRWCAACYQEVKGLGAGAFKCRPCAEQQYREVERFCVVAGYGGEDGPQC